MVNGEVTLNFSKRSFRLNMNPIRKSGVFLLLNVMAKEKSKEKKLKKLNMQLVQFRDNPVKVKNIQNRIATVESGK